MFEQDLQAFLGTLADQIQTLEPSSQEELAPIGMALEEATDKLPEDCPEAAEVFDLVLNVLQEVYLGQTADPASALKAMAESLRAAEAYLASKEDATREALLSESQTLQEILGSKAEPDNSTQASAASAEPQESPQATLDDAVAMLMGLGHEDHEALASVCDLLSSLLQTSALAPEVLDHTLQAKQIIDRIVSGQIEDSEAAFARASEDIEQAVRLRDAAEMNQPPLEISADAKAEQEATQTSSDIAEAAAPETQSTESKAAGEFDPENPPTLPAEADPELMGEYIIESLDQIQTAEGALLDLESDPEESEPIHKVFRAFHTIKGTSGFMGLSFIQRLAHLAENLLDRARDGKIRLTGGYADLALESCDAIKDMIAGLEGLAIGDPLLIPEHYSQLIENLTDPEAAGFSEETDDVVSVPRIGDILVAEGKAARQDVEVAAAEQGTTPVGETLLKFGAAKSPDVAKALRTQKRLGGKHVSDSTIRVTTTRLDNLINMVGELVISHSMVAQDINLADGTDPRLSRNVNQSGKIVRELQDLTMSLRMVPLKATFQKMARLVRDLAHKAGKSVSFIPDGEDTEIDRNMVELLGDPLVHMVRNAVDHGIESSEDRIQAGKPKAGTVTLRAYQSAGNVVIELSDDGKGLDRSRILAKAVERELIKPDHELPDSEVFNLIFHPGFSTAEKVTEISGRGVGMDVVKKAIDALRGRVEITSQAGQGSTFTIRLPLTMAIADAMLLKVGDQRYLLPTVSIVQSFRPEAEAISTVIGRGETVLLRGNLIPLYRLHRLFNVPDAVSDPCKGILVVVDAQGKQCALLVDDLLGQQQVVIKTLGSALGRIPGVAGAAILGDGHVGLILDAAGIISLARNEGSATAEATLVAN